GVHPADDGRAGVQHQGGVLGTHPAGDALDDDSGVLVQVDGHVWVYFSLARVRGCSGVGQLGGLVGPAVHGLGQGDQRVGTLVEDRAPLVHVVAVQAHHQRLGGGVAEQVQGADDAVGDLVAGGDPTEDVHEHGLHLLVTQDHVQAGGHHLGVGAAADVQEVGGLHPAVLLACVGDHVQGGHHQA